MRVCKKLAVVFFCAVQLSSTKISAVQLLSVSEGLERAMFYVGQNTVQNGKTQLELLQREGLKSSGYVLEIGCGCLVAGIPIMSCLRRGHYVGIEPNKWLLDDTLNIRGNAAVITDKRPLFLYNTDFDASSAHIKFDFVLAHSVMSHAAYWQLDLFLKNCANVLKDGGKVIFSIRLTEPNKFGNKGAPKETCDEVWQYPGNSYFDKKTVIKKAAAFFRKIEQKELYTELIMATDKSAFHDWFVLTK